MGRACTRFPRRPALLPHEGGPPCPVCLSALCHVCADGQEEIKVTAVKQHTRAHGLGQQSGRPSHVPSVGRLRLHALHRSGRCVLSLSTSRLWHVCGRPIGYRLPIDGTTAHTGHNRGKGRASHPHGARAEERHRDEACYPASRGVIEVGRPVSYRPTVGRWPHRGPHEIFSGPARRVIG